ncbi:MAG: tandem-95 repeat protein [Candidatus Neomarinimicrobiota bacterium]
MGKTIVTVNVFDGVGASDATSFNLTVENVDDAPTVKDYIEDIALYEDFSQPWNVNLNEVFQDIDGILTFTAEVEDPSLINLDIMNGVLSLNSVQDAFGETLMLVTALNPMRESVTDSVLVTVTGISDAPLMTQIEDISINEDEELTIILEGSDIDGDDIYYAVEPMQNINSAINGDTLNLIPMPNWNGEVSVTVYCLDGTGESDQSIFTLNVNSVDDVPIVSNSLSDIYLNEDFKQNWSVNLDDVFTDIDGELEYTAELLDPSIVEMNLSSSTLSLVAIDDQNGQSDIIITATNPTRESVSDTVLVTIQAINDAPVMHAISDTIINEDQEVVLQLSGSDVDGDELSFVVEPIEHVNSYISGDGTILNLIPEQDWFGETQVVVNVLDGSGLTDSTAFSLIVLSVDDDPIQDGYLADMFFNEDFEDPWTINLNEVFIDIDGELSFTAYLDNPDVIGMYLTEGFLSFYAFEDAFGETELIVTASNTMRTSISDTLMITVHTINDAPVLSAISNVETDEDQMIMVTLDGYDADGDSVYYSIETPDQIGSIISPDNSELTLMPIENWFGLSEITVTLHDGSGLMATETFSLMVNPINDAPSFHFTDSLTVNEGSDITFMSMADLYNSGQVIDVDDSLEALEFSLTLLDLPFTINWDGELESVPVLENIAPNFSGPGGLILNVSDGIYLVHDTIPVMVYNINTPTVVGVMDTIFVDEDDDISIMSMEALYNNGLISDIDNNFNELSFSLEINSDEIQIEWDGSIGSTPLIVPDSNLFGEYVLTLCVNDGDNNSCSENTLVINPVNDAPTLSVIENISINEGEDVLLPSMEELYAENALVDIDTDFEDLTYVYHVENLPLSIDWDSSASSQPLFIQNNDDFVGDGLIESCVSDGEFTVCDSTYLTVLAVNDPPMISELDTIYMIEDQNFLMAEYS